MKNFLICFLFGTTIACKNGSQLPPPDLTHCFVPATEDQLRQSLYAVESENMQTELLYRHRPESSMELIGKGWAHYWEERPTGLLQMGDIVFSIDSCGVDEVLAASVKGNEVAPFRANSYISKFDLLLVGPPEEIVEHIKEVTIQRNGKRLILIVRGIEHGRIRIDVRPVFTTKNS